MDYQHDSLFVVATNLWNRFQKRSTHSIHLNINGLLSKIDEIRYIAKPANATVIWLSETKLCNTVLSSELEIEGYDLIRSDRFRKGLKPVLIGILYRLSDKYDFLNFLERPFIDTNVFKSQEWYLLGDININLLPKDKEVFRQKSVNTINKEIPHFTGSYLKLCFTHSLEQIITRPTRATDQTVTLINHILTNSPDKVTQLGVICIGLSYHDLIYCTRKTSLPKSHEPNEIIVCSMNRYSTEKFLEFLRKIIFANYLI